MSDHSTTTPPIDAILSHGIADEARRPGPLTRLVDWFISGRIKEQSPDAVRRARIIAGGSLIYLAIAPLYVADLLHASLAGAAAIGGIVLVLFANLFVLKHARSTKAPVAILLCSIALADSIQMYVFGGLNSAPALWAVLAPLIVVLLAGPRWGLAAAIYFVLVAVVFYAMETAGHEFPRPVEPSMVLRAHLLSFATAVLFASAMGKIYESTRRRFEDGLRRSEARFREIAELLPETVFEMRIDGRLTFLNRTGFDASGYTPQDLTAGLSALELIHPDDRARARENMEIRIAGREVHNHEYRGLRRDGTGFPIMMRSRAIVRDGAAVGLRGIAVDISEQKRTEEEWRRAKEAAEDASLAKSQFLANMSHEIRTPMNGVLGTLDLALEGQLAPEQREYLELSRRSADVLMGIIDGILDLSKLEAGRVEISSAPFSLVDCVHQSVSALAVQAQKKGLELVWEPPPIGQDRVTGDELRLRQVLSNLVGNAIKFTSRGEVVVTVETQSEDDENVCLRFVVRDSGIGIPPEKARTIFEPFTQADGGTTRDHGGTGLGLTISKKLVTLMGGEIRVESEPGVGSTFSFTICVRRQSGAAEPVPETRPSLLSEQRVLVVDDNETNRTVLVGTLSPRCARVCATTSGPEALAEVKRAHADGQPFDIALVDIVMPEMDGYQLRDALRTAPGGEDIKVVLLSSASKAITVPDRYKSDDTAFLAKPIHPSALLETLAGMATVKKRKPETTGPVPPRAPVESSGVRVLVAEDNDVNRTLVVRMLERCGHTATAVENGREACEAYRGGGYDVILMDIQMPVMGGFEATAEIRAHEKEHGGHVPIIALTAHAMVGDEESCIDAGMDGYVAKPMRRKDLDAAIRKVLGG